MKKIIYKILGDLIMFLCSMQWKYYNKDIFYVKGNGNDDGKYLLYTERKNIAERMHKF